MASQRMMTSIFNGLTGILQQVGRWHTVRIGQRMPLKGQIMKLKDFFGGHPLDSFPRVRKDDPVTSYEAAAQVSADKHYGLIAECLEAYGPLGKDGIASKTKLDPVQISRRLSEMQRIGLIQLTGNTVKSNTGRNEREWTIKEES